MLSCPVAKARTIAQNISLRASVVSSTGAGTKIPAANEQQQELSSSGEEKQEVRVKLVVKRGWRDLVGVVFGL